MIDTLFGCNRQVQIRISLEIGGTRNRLFSILLLAWTAQSSNGIRTLLQVF